VSFPAGENPSSSAGGTIFGFSFPSIEWLDYRWVKLGIKRCNGLLAARQEDRRDRLQFGY